MTDATTEILRLVPRHALIDKGPGRLPRHPPAVAGQTDNIEMFDGHTQFVRPKKIDKMQIVV